VELAENIEVTVQSLDSGRIVMNHRPSNNSARFFRQELLRALIETSMNRYPLWKYLLILVVAGRADLHPAEFYGESPAADIAVAPA
jgi:hypothetical protein